MAERWKEFFKGYYEVSNKGRIRRSKPAKKTYVGKILKLGKDKDGYLLVQLSRPGKRHTYRVNKIVARKFIGPCPEGKEVNHKDLNKQNNRDNNLEYVTHVGNLQHAIDCGVDMHFLGGTNKLRRKNVL